MNKKIVHVVPHSHWDREWYFSINDSNILLDENLTYLMDVLEENKEFNSYTFDAQLSIVEDYIRYNPSELTRIMRLLEDKRIFVGPWYTQCDTLTINKESIIKNLLYGTKLGQKFGYSMQVGYLPDIFGQNSYLPSIFKGFEINHSVLQRGIYNDELNNDLNFKWYSPDNNYVMANNIYLGYGPGKFLSSDDNYINEKLLPMLAKLESLNQNCDSLLLPAGGDQVLVRKNFPKIIEELNEKCSQYYFVLSDYETFMKDAWSKEYHNELHGELIGCEKSRIHNTIKSQRYDIKKLNYDVENKLLYQLEPLLVIGKEHNVKCKQLWIDQIWKLLFDVHSHDSIGGCNSDETNNNIMERLKTANSLVDNLIHIIKRQITNVIAKKINYDNILVLFNLNLTKTNEYHKAIIFSKSNDFKLVNVDDSVVEFEKVNTTKISGGKQVVVTADGEKEIEVDPYYRSEVLIKNNTLPTLGYKTLKVIEEKHIEKDEVKLSNNNYIENSNYKITINNNELSCLVKQSNKVIDNFIKFEDGADTGDSYDYSPLVNEELNIVTKFELIKVIDKEYYSEMHLKSTYETYIDLENRIAKQEKTIVEITTIITLYQDKNYLAIKHQITNNVKEHRVRVLLDTTLNTNYSISDQGFGLIKRNNTNERLENWRENKYAEAPIAVYPIENFVALTDNEKYYGVVCKGLKEYEVLNNSTIALTLFRSVGLLGKDDLVYRPGRASGINNKVVETIDAQMLENMEFEYAISINTSNDLANEMFDICDEYIVKYVSYHNQKLNLFEERLERFEIPLIEMDVNHEYQLLRLNNKRLKVSSIANAWDKDGYIVRIFNPNNNEEILDLSVDSEYHVTITNLAQNYLSDYTNNQTIKPNAYLTIKISKNKE